MKRLVLLPASLLALAAAIAPLHAGTRYWDPSGSATPGGGSGTWWPTDLAGSFAGTTVWVTAAGSTVRFAWTNANGDDAYFTGAAGTVINRASAGQIALARAMWVQSDGYIFTTASSGAYVTNTSGTINVAASCTAHVVGANFGFSVTTSPRVLVKSSAGTLSFEPGAYTGYRLYADKVKILAGTYVISGSTSGNDNNAGFPAAPSSLTADWFSIGGGGTFTFSSTTAATLSSTNEGFTIASGGGAINVASTGGLTLPGAVTLTGNFTKSGTGTLTLNGAGSGTGTVSISTGTLKLGVAAAVSTSSSQISVAAGGTLDVSSLTPYIFSTNTTLAASGTGTTVGTTAAAIKGASGYAVNLGSNPITLTYDSAHPALFISQGALVLNKNPFTVNTTNSSGLANGTYTIIQQASGTITNTTPFTVTGTAIGSGSVGSISVTNGTNVNLIVSASSGTGTTTTLTRTAGSSPSTYGNTLTFQAVVSPDPGASTITFKTNGTAFGTSTTSGGTAALTISNLRYSGGSAWTVTAEFAGNGSYTASSGTLSGGQQVNQTNLTVTAAACTKTYDGTTSATGTPTITAGSIQTGDTAPTWTETYDTRNVGTGKTLTPAGVVNDGNGGNNYHYTYATTTGTINKTSLTVTAVTCTKTYDGTTSATGTPTITAGSIQTGDTAPTWTQTYNNDNAGTGKTLTPAGVVSDGNSGNNYSYTYATVTTGVINKTNLTVTAVACTKTYDGTTSATGTPTITAGSIQTGDTAPTWTQTYNNDNAGTGKTLTPAGVVSDGNGGNNYNYTYATVATGVINKTNLTVTAVACTKTYDGTTSATGTPTITAGSIQTGDTAPTWTQTYNNDNAGTGKTLTPAGVVSDGNSGANYAYTYATLTTGVINKTNLTVTAAACTKTYDGTTSATGTPTITAGTIQTGDTVPTWTETYDTKNVGTGKTLTPAGVVSDGNGGANYAYTYATLTTGVINKTNLTVTAAANTKTYDGGISAAAAPTVTSGSVQTGDTAAFTETYDTRNAGTGKTLTPAGVVSDGNGGANYAYTYATVTTGAINKTGLTVTAAASTKTYDGTTSATGTPTITAGAIQTGDTAPAWTETYDTRNVGTGKTLTPAGVVSDGNGGANYAVTRMRRRPRA